jgi:uncharacterized cysteine cluster protein YcgN (CxxCxxCC family)
VKKGRHRRFEEARALKRITLEPSTAPCDECASWCLARVPEDDLDDEGIEGEFDEELADEFHHAPNEAANH